MSDTRKGESAKPETDIVSVGAKTGSNPMTEATHALGPWKVRPGPKWADGDNIIAWMVIVDSKGAEIAFVESEDYARRIIAAVNASKGMPIEALEAIAKAIGEDS